MKIEAGDFGTAGSLLFQLFLWNKCLHCIFNGKCAQCCSCFVINDAGCTIDVVGFGFADGGCVADGVG